MTQTNNTNRISDSAQIGKGVKIGHNVSIGSGCKIGDNVTVSDNSIIYPNCEIGADSFIGPFVTLGEPTYKYYDDVEGFVFPTTKIGNFSLIRSYSLVYADVIIDEGFQCGHRVSIREKTKIGKNVRIGTVSDIQGHCSIGDYSRLHSNVHIGQNSIIDPFVWIFPYVVLTNDPTPPSNELYGVTLKRFSVIATGSIILPGVVVNEDGFVGAHSLVKKDVPAETVVAGVPAVDICSVRKLKNKKTGQTPYPWRYYFDRGMPWEGIGYDNWALVDEKK